MTPPARDERRWTLGMSCATATMGTPNQAPPHRVNGRGHGTEGMSSMRAERTANGYDFWSRVAVGEPDACWPWQRETSHGYGRVHAPRTQFHGWQAHRVGWFLTHGPIPVDDHGKTLLVCHRCDNPPCCNPAHLFLGTHADNMADMVQKGRRNSPWSQPSWRAKRGSEHSHPKLNEDAVREIRLLLAEGNLSQRQIGERFGVTRQAVSNIVQGHTWSWLI